VLDRGTLLENIHNAAEEKVRTLEAELKTAREYLERIFDEKLEFVSKVDALVKPEASK
jgi:hypothetical protein